MTTEKKELLEMQLKDRKEYAEFEAWCTEYNPDGWMPFDEWLVLRKSASIADAHIVWNTEDPGAA